MKLSLIVGIIIAVLLYHFVPSFQKNNTPSHVIAAIDYHNKAAAVGNKPGGLILPESDWIVIIDYYKKALAEAEQAGIADMNKHYPGFGDHFRDEFIEGLRLIISNDGTLAKTPSLLRGQLLESKFGDWYSANHDAMRKR
jgi:hypothetical protein